VNQEAFVQRNFDVIRPGWAVVGSDDDKIGDITDVRPSYLLLQKGLIFVKDIYVPMSAIRDVDPDGERVYLEVTKDRVEDMGWDAPPSDEAMASGSYQSGAGWEAETRTDVHTHEAPPVDDRAAATGRKGAKRTEDAQRVELHEERLGAQTRSDTVGEVEIGKRVVEQEQELEVPVTREEVEVRRVRTDRPDSGDERPFVEGDTIRVPVTAETVEVTKDARVVEEIEVSKRPITETKRVSDTVRREEVDVRQEGDIHVADDSRELAGAGSSRMAGNRDWQDDPERRGEAWDPALDSEAGTTDPTLTDDERRLR
jgi:uncharacterized protein (TIGR02271 family)